VHLLSAQRTCTRSSTVGVFSCHNTRFLLTRNASLVDRSASEKDIRKAYKRLSRKYHPDKNQEPGAEEKFVDIAHGQLDLPMTYNMLLKPFSSVRSTVRHYCTRFFCFVLYNDFILTSFHRRNGKFMTDMER
jgi:hypothetical protein